MKLGELKAFIEGMDIEEGSAPTPDQWGRIREKLQAVTPEVRYESAPYFGPDRLGLPVPPYTVT